MVDGTWGCPYALRFLAVSTETQDLSVLLKKDAGDGRGPSVRPECVQYA